jgi:Mn-dependent DtxR family transcriptional regulator
MNIEQNSHKSEKALRIGGVRRSYSVVSEMDVINIILRTAEDWQGVGIISPSNIASLLKTSRYQVDKHIKSLKKKELIEYKSIMIGSEEDFYPPYNGYGLTKEGKVKFAKELKEIADRDIELIKECFGA